MTDHVFLNVFFSSDEQVNDSPEPQHYMSDSELELHQSQENIARENEIRWAWGKLPQVWFVILSYPPAFSLNGRH